MLLKFEWQTAMSQSAGADKTHHSFNCFIRQFRIICFWWSLTHKGCQVDHMCKRKMFWQICGAATFSVGPYIGELAFLSHGDMLSLLLNNISLTLTPGSPVSPTGPGRPWNHTYHTCKWHHIMIDITPTVYTEGFQHQQLVYCIGLERTLHAASSTHIIISDICAKSSGAVEISKRSHWVFHLQSAHMKHSESYSIFFLRSDLFGCAF